MISMKLALCQFVQVCLFVQEAGYLYHHGEVEWTEQSTLAYPALCSIAGLVAGMFGVGGGIVKIGPS